MDLSTDAGVLAATPNSPADRSGDLVDFFLAT